VNNKTQGGKMKSSILALIVFLTGAFAQAAETSRLVFHCDQKHGPYYAGVYYTGESFYICFYRATETVRDEVSDTACRNPIWSEDWWHKDDMIKIDFHRGWMFEGDEKGGVLWSRRTTFLCETPRSTTN
jgi:hypothetical protein